MKLFMALLVFATGIIITAPQAAASGCPSTATYVVGGYGDPHSVKVPGVGAGWVSRVHYPADVFQGDYSRQVVVDVLDRRARNMRDFCANTHIRVVAFSLGASAASLVTDRWVGTPMGVNVSALFFGNPRKPARNGWGGIETVGLPHLGFYHWRGPHREAPWIRNVCNERRDLVCSAPRPLTSDPVGALKAFVGYASGGHQY